MQLEATAELRDPEMNPAKKALLEVRPSLVPGADGKYKFFHGLDSWMITSIYCIDAVRIT